MRLFASSSARGRRTLGMLLMVILLAWPSGPAVAQGDTPLLSARSLVERVPDGYELFAESEHLQLHLNPITAEIAVRDRRSSKVWLSTPWGSQSEDVRSNLRTTFRSVFFAYLTRGGGTQALRLSSADDRWDFRIEALDGGASVVYELAEGGVSVTLRYTLGPDYLDVAIADASLVESGERSFLEIELLPYLGAMPYQTDVPSYLVLPDGPGSLTYLSGSQPAARKKFSAPAYGPSTYSFARPSDQRTPLPVYGLVQPDGAVLGVAIEGAGDSSIEASVSHNEASLSQASIRFVYRRLSQFPEGKGAFSPYYQEKRIGGDRSLRFFFLAEDGASWVGLACRLREHLMEDRGVPRLSEEAAEPALRLRMVMGAARPGLFGSRFVAATSFAEAAEIVKAYRDAGMTNLDIVLKGWGKDGYEGNLPKRWPPDRRLGGARGLTVFIASAHALGTRVFLEGDYRLAFLQNRGFLPLTDIVFLPNLLPITDLVSYGMGQEVPRSLTRNRFLLNLVYAIDKYVEPETRKLVEMGVDGLELRWAGEMLLPDSNRRRPLERSDAAEEWRRMLRIISETTGSVGTVGGNGFVLGVADTVVGLPFRPTNTVFADETIPFYQVATHGLVRLFGEPLNLDADPRRDALRRLEYGMLPVCEVTYRDPMVLERTTYDQLYRSNYLDLMDEVEHEYRAAVGELGHTVNLFIVGHRILAPGVHETTYEDGTRVIVNYTDETYERAGLQVAHLGYEVVRGD